MAGGSRRNTPFSAHPLLRVTLPAYRSHLLMAGVALAFVALGARAVYLQVFSQDFLQRQGESRYARTLDLPASRGEIRLVDVDPAEPGGVDSHGWHSFA